MDFYVYNFKHVHMKRLILVLFFFFFEGHDEGKNKAVFDTITAYMEMLFNSMKLSGERLTFLRKSQSYELVFCELFT